MFSQTQVFVTVDGAMPLRALSLPQFSFQLHWISILIIVIHLFININLTINLYYFQVDDNSTLLVGEILHQFYSEIFCANKSLCIITGLTATGLTAHLANSWMMTIGHLLEKFYANFTRRYSAPTCLMGIHPEFSFVKPYCS